MEENLACFDLRCDRNTNLCGNRCIDPRRYAAFQALRSVNIELSDSTDQDVNVLSTSL